MALTSLPNAGQSLNVTRDPVRNNFDLIQAGFVVDHYDWGSAGNVNGKHKHVTLPDQAANYIPTAGQCAIYAQTNATTLVNEIYITNSAGTTKPLTAFSNAGGEGSGWYYAPSGHLIKYGSATISAGTSVVVDTATFGPAFSTAAYNVLVTPKLATIVKYVMVIVTNKTSPGQFTINAALANGGSAAPIGFFYQVIGY